MLPVSEKFAHPKPAAWDDVAGHAQRRTDGRPPALDRAIRALYR